MKLGIISDTHNLLRPEVLDTLHSCDAILHAGDCSRADIVQRLGEIAPLYVVRGNNDATWAADIPYQRRFALGSVRFFMTHNKRDVPDELGDVQVVIYGHSHKYAGEIVSGRLWLNPGSCGRRRFQQEITMATMDIDEDGSYRVKKIVIPHEEKSSK